MATVSLLQVWNPTTKQYESVEGENGSINVTATITGGDAATETTLAAVENAVDGLEAGQTSTNSKLDTLATQTDGLEGSATTTATNTGTIATSVDGLEGSVVTNDTSFVSNGAAVSATVKSSAGTLYSVYAHNNNASTTLYLWLSNSLSAGGTLMVAPIRLVAGAQLFIDATYFTSDGRDFSTGFTWGFSSTLATYTAHVTAGDCIISGGYE